MLHYALLFFLLAIVCGVLLGWGGLSGALMWGAEVCVVLFVILAVLSLFRGGSLPSDPSL